MESSLVELRQENAQLRALLDDRADKSRGQPSAASIAIPSLSALHDGMHIKDRSQVSRVPGNYFRARRNTRNYGRGVFKPPYAYRTPALQQSCPDAGPPLPPFSVTQYLISRYKLILHFFQPILHMPAFQAEIDELYRAGSFRGVRKSWIGTFFAVLACSTNISDDRSLLSHAWEYLEYAINQVNTLSDEVDIDHARTSLMISLFFMEQNRRSAAWIWLGAAVRTAQESGLHMEQSSSMDPLQAELRRRTWWAIYNWDRYDYSRQT